MRSFHLYIPRERYLSFIEWIFLKFGLLVIIEEEN